MNYKIIQTGSKGNAVVYENKILVDCGVPFNKIKNYYKKIKLVMLTHRHFDHFNKSTIKKLAEERPTLRFGCCEWLVEELISLGVKAKNIDVYEIGKTYNYREFSISPILLYHNVPQCGYRIFINNYKILYATDTNSLEGIEAVGYDYYFVEANHILEEIEERIKAKEILGIYCYEKDAIKNHLSKEKCDAFLLENMTDKSQYIYMHQSEKKEELNC